MKDNLISVNLMCLNCSGQLKEYFKPFNNSKVILECDKCSNLFKIYPDAEKANRAMIKKRNLIIFGILGIGLIQSFRLFSSGDIQYGLILVTVNLLSAIAFYFIFRKNNNLSPDINYNVLLELSSEDEKDINHKKVINKYSRIKVYGLIFSIVAMASMYLYSKWYTNRLIEDINQQKRSAP